MSIGDFFKGLILDVWYKVFIYIGGVALVLSFFLEVKGITNAQLQLIAGGALLLGIGEWKNHKQESWFKPPSAYTGPSALMTRTVWKPDVIGIALDLIGLALVVMGMISIIGDTSNTSTPTTIIATPAATPTLKPTITPTISVEPPTMP